VVDTVLFLDIDGVLNDAAFVRAALQGRADRVRIRWSPLAQVWAASTWPSFAAWLYAKGLVPMVCLSNADLSRAIPAACDGTRCHSRSTPRGMGWLTLTQLDGVCHDVPR
jgi:hypothetical protein